MLLRLLAALPALLFASHAWAVLALDGTPQTGSISGAAASTVASAAFSTTASNDVVIALITTSNATASTVSSISGGGLTWTKRKQFTILTSSFTTGSIEEWSAVAASPLTSQVITANLSITALSATISVFAFSGGNTTTPFDVNAALPATNSDVTGTSTIPTVSAISTTNANTALIAFVSTPGAAGSALTDPASFTQLIFNNGFSGTPNFLGGAAQSDYRIVSSTQSGISVAYSTVTNWGMLVDAVQMAGAAPSPGLAQPFQIFGFGP